MKPRSPDQGSCSGYEIQLEQVDCKDKQEINLVAAQPMTYDGPPMTLGNMRSLGVGSLQVYCACGHDAVVDMAGRPDHRAVKSFEAHMVCSKCGSKTVDVRPNRAEYAPTKGAVPSFPPGPPVKKR